jgi:hypothetical protein
LIIFYVVLILLALWKCKFSGKGFFTEESFSKDVTNSVKGIFIWLVFLRHFSDYFRSDSTIDLLGVIFSSILGQMIVACFLFYSGFGVFESFKKKGLEYAKTMPKNRILKTLVHFDIALMLFLIIQVIFGGKLSFSRIIFSLIGWESLGNSNWYIFVILLLYLVTCLSFICAKENINKAGITVTFSSLMIILFLYFTRPTYWYDTVLCYALGAWISIFKEKFLRFITKKNSLWIIVTATSIVIFSLLRIGDFLINTKLNYIIKLFTAPVFCLVIIILLTKFKISNKILVFSGENLFGIYMLQRIPMILFKAFGLAKFNLYIYFIVCLVSTIALSIVFRYLTSKIDSVFLKTKPLKI